MNCVKRFVRVLPLAALLPLALTLQGCLDEPVAGTRLAVRSFPAEPEHNSVFFWSKDSHIMLPPTGPTYASPTMYGGSVELYNPTTGKRDVYQLPAKNWKFVSVPHNSYRYVDVSQQDGPCQFVSVTEGQSLIALCRGSNVHFTLDEAQQGSLNINVILGYDDPKPPNRVRRFGTRYCASFGGQVMRDSSTAHRAFGTFLAKNAPAPGACAIS